MNKAIVKDNNGITLIKIILLILVTILVVFLAYEIIYADAFGIMDKNKNPIDLFANRSETSDNNYKNVQNSVQNVQAITPILGEIDYESPNISDNSINHYYYNQLDDAGKIIYKGLEDNIENMKSGDYKISFGTKFNNLLNSSNGEKKLNVAFQSAWNAFTYDYVDIFYIDVTKLILTTQTTTIGNYSTHKVYLSNGDNNTYLSDEIGSYEDLQNKVSYISDMRNKIVNKLDGYSEYDQIRYLHNWIVDNFEYDTTYKRDNIHNVYGAFKNRKVVCEGYARALKYILDGLGIESVLISGTATNSNGDTESHAWNYVKLNEKWYAIDVTWDDPVITGGGSLSDEHRYKYFLKGSNEFLQNHEEDGYVSENSIKFKFPKLEKGNYN